MALVGLRIRHPMTSGSTADSWTVTAVTIELEVTATLHPEVDFVASIGRSEGMASGTSSASSHGACLPIQASTVCHREL